MEAFITSLAHGGLAVIVIMIVSTLFSAAADTIRRNFDVSTNLLITSLLACLIWIAATEIVSRLDTLIALAE